MLLGCHESYRLVFLCDVCQADKNKGHKVELIVDLQKPNDLTRPGDSIRWTRDEEIRECMMQGKIRIMPVWFGSLILTWDSNKTWTRLHCFPDAWQCQCGGPMSCVNFAHTPTAARIVDGKREYDATCMHKDIGTVLSMCGLNFQPNAKLLWRKFCRDYIFQKILALFLRMDHVLLQACYFCCVLQTFLPSFAKKLLAQQKSRWWFQFFFKFHPENWGNDPIWRLHIFQMGWLKPPTRWCFGFHVPSISMGPTLLQTKAVKRSFIPQEADADAFVCVKVNDTWMPIRSSESKWDFSRWKKSMVFAIASIGFFFWKNLKVFFRLISDIRDFHPRQKMCSMVIKTHTL